MIILSIKLILLCRTGYYKRRWHV